MPARRTSLHPHIRRQCYPLVHSQHWDCHSRGARRPRPWLARQPSPTYSPPTSRRLQRTLRPPFRHARRPPRGPHITAPHLAPFVGAPHLMPLSTPPPSAVDRLRRTLARAPTTSLHTMHASPLPRTSRNSAARALPQHKHAAPLPSCAGPEHPTTTGAASTRKPALLAPSQPPLSSFA